MIWNSSQPPNLSSLKQAMFISNSCFMSVAGLLRALHYSSPSGTSVASAATILKCISQNQRRKRTV